MRQASAIQIKEARHRVRDVKLSVDNALDCLECLSSCDYKAAGVFVF